MASKNREKPTEKNTETIETRAIHMNDGFTRCVFAEIYTFRKFSFVQTTTTFSMKSQHETPHFKQLANILLNFAFNLNKHKHTWVAYKTIANFSFHFIDGFWST